MRFDLELDLAVREDVVWRTCFAPGCHEVQTVRERCPACGGPAHTSIDDWAMGEVAARQERTKQSMTFERRIQEIDRLVAEYRRRQGTERHAP